MKKIPLVAAIALAAAFTGRTAPADDTRFEQKLAQDQQVLHALRRLTFGPRPGDVDAVNQMGLEKWIELQLHPERIPENPKVDALLAPLDSIRMSPQQVVANYPPPQLIRAIAQGKQAYPDNPLVQAALERAADRLKIKKDADPAAKKTAAPLSDFLQPQQIRALRNGTADEKRAVLASIPDDKLDDVVVALPQGQRQQLMAVADPTLRHKITVAAAPGRVTQADLIEAKLDRAIYSNRQLQEQMTDFFFNHFNVYLNKGADRILTPTFERESIRPHVFGKFRDLLEATATSPAMLFYLDNWQSVAPNAPQALRRAKGKAGTRGLNENYARELMELHTLGVDGGYTQKDVTEVARCFTGWTIRTPNLGGGFFFNERVHDRGEKTVLGVKIPAGGGREDGEKVLDILARQPATARFISTKLAHKFVADDPPPALIDRMAKTFLDTGGDIRRVMETMIASPEFFSEGAWQAKVKTPLEMIVSAVRATGADVRYTVPLAQKIGEMGQPLYEKVEPTGYPTANAEWVNSAALLARMNFSLALAANRVPGVTLDGSQFSGEPQEAARQVLFHAPSDQTLAAIQASLAQKDTPVTLVGLVLGSPDFQRR